MLISDVGVCKISWYFFPLNSFVALASACVAHQPPLSNGNNFNHYRILLVGASVQGTLPALRKLQPCEAEPADCPFPNLSGDETWYKDRKIRPIQILSPKPPGRRFSSLWWNMSPVSSFTHGTEWIWHHLCTVPFPSNWVCPGDAGDPSYFLGSLPGQLLTQQCSHQVPLPSMCIF